MRAAYTRYPPYARWDTIDSWLDNLFNRQQHLMQSIPYTLCLLRTSILVSNREGKKKNWPIAWEQMEAHAHTCMYACMMWSINWWFVQADSQTDLDLALALIYFIDLYVLYMFNGRPSVTVFIERDSINWAKGRGFSNESYFSNSISKLGLLLVTKVGLRNHKEVFQDYSRPFHNWSFRELNRQPDPRSSPFESTK